MLNDDEGKKVQHLLEVMVEKVSFFKKKSRRSFQNSDLHIPKSLKCKKRNGLFPKLLFKSFFFYENSLCWWKKNFNQSFFS